MLLDDNAHKRVEQAVVDAEKKTSAEIAVIELARAASYTGHRALFAAVLTFAVGFSLHLFVPALSALTVLLLQPIIAVAAWFASGWAPLLKALVPDEQERQAVSERTAQLFSERVFGRTAARGGVLLLLSDFEKEVRLVPDEKVAAALTAQRLAGLVDGVTTAIRSGHPADGVVECVRLLGAELSGPLPPGPGDANELPNQVLRG